MNRSYADRLPMHAEAITGRDNPRSMVPVRQAGAEVIYDLLGQSGGTL